MIVVTQQDVTVMRMAIDTLLECVRQTERWEASGDAVACRRTHELVGAILRTRRKFVSADEVDVEIENALMVAEGLREAAGHCNAGQTALHARLVKGADAIERLCCRKEA